MFDVNLNKTELEAIYRLLEIDTPGARNEVIGVVENLLEMRFIRGKKLGRDEIINAIVESIVSELGR